MKQDGTGSFCYMPSPGNAVTSVKIIIQDPLFFSSAIVVIAHISLKNRECIWAPCYVETVTYIAS
jgi:hypothetical protein